MPAALNTPKGRPELRDLGVHASIDAAALNTPKGRPELRENSIDHKQTQTQTRTQATKASSIDASGCPQLSTPPRGAQSCGT